MMNPASLLALHVEIASEGTTVTAALSVPCSVKRGPGISFKRCEASCCTQDDLPSAWPPSSTVPGTSSMSVNATQTPATKAARH